MTARTRLLVAAVWCGVAATLAAQGPPGAPPGPPRSPRAAAPVDLTGHWVSVIAEDWRWRMVTPLKGDSASIPITPEARAIVDAWDPARDDVAGLAGRIIAQIRHAVPAIITPFPSCSHRSCGCSAAACPGAPWTRNRRLAQQRDAGRKPRG